MYIIYSTYRSYVHAATLLNIGLVLEAVARRALATAQR